MASNRITTYPAAVYYEANWNTPPGSTLPPLWTDITRRALGQQSVNHGKQYELDLNEAGTYQPVLDNRDGALDPSNPASPYAPNVVPYRGIRERRRFNANLLTTDQATAGEGTPAAGTIPVWLGVGNNQGYPVTIVGSGTAYQGTQVFQAVLPIGATTGATVLVLRGDAGVPGAAVVPGRAYSWQAQCRIPSGNSVSTQAAIAWYDNLGNALGTVTGSASTLTSGSATWVQLSASGTAPTGAFSAWLYVQIASGTLAAQTTWQADGLQWEESAAPTAWQSPSTVSVNLLPRAIATGTASINPVSDSAANWFLPVAGSVARVTNLTAAPTGHTTAVGWTTSSGTTSASPLYAGIAPTGGSATGPVADCVQVTATQQYTASVYLMRVSSADATVQVTPAIAWYDSGGNALTPSTGSAVTVAAGSWVRATVTGTAPAGAVWGRPRVAITTPASTTATNTVYSVGWQVEQAAAASTWSDPGLTVFGFTGYLDQLPQRWRLSQTWGELDAEAVDALAGFAQYTVQAPFIEEVLQLAPSFFYQLADPAGSSMCTDTAAVRPAAPVEVSPFGAGSLVFGSSITSTNIGSAFIGTPGPVATFNNNPANTPQLAQTYISLHKTTVTPGPPTSGAWSRMIAFRCSSIPASSTFPTLWNANTPSYGSNQSLFQIYIDPTTGFLVVQLSGPAGTGPVVTSAGNVCDGNWHQVALCYTPGSFVDVYLDGAQIYHNNHSGAGWPAPTAIITDVIGCSITPGASNYSLGFVGDAADAIQFGFALTQAQATNLYNSWRTASTGESTGARTKRLAGWVGWTGPTSIDNGQTASMGPATDLAGASALDGLNSIAVTEGGNVYADLGGALAFRSRAASYNSAPVFIFGENQQWGEWPFEDVLLPDDTVQTYNIVPTTQYSTGQVALAQDATSQANYFPRTYSGRTINSTSFPEVTDAGAYLLRQHKTPAIRCSGLRIHASAIPGLMRVCSQLEIGTRIRVYKGSPYRSTRIQFDGFVQKIEHSRDPVSGDTVYTLEASPADLAAYWVLAALHTTLNTQAANGQNQAVLNALPDAWVNEFAWSVPQGYQLVFEPGTPRQETMTLSPTGIPFTGVGYQTVTLTFTSNFGFTHPANSVVCEPLLAGYTDPTTWDASSVIGAASAVLAAGSNSGTNTITIGPLPDSAVNALGSDWNTGDLLWINPGGGTFEGYNRLTPNVSTAGEGVLPLPTGTFGFNVGLFSAYGSNLLAVTASANAFQGANVWAVSVAGAATTGQDLISALKLPVAAGLSFTGSFYVRSATSGQNPHCQPYIQWYDAYYNPVGSPTTGAAVTLTGGSSAAWTRVTASATAPATAVFGRIGVTLTSAPAGSWSFQADGLQFEQAASASTYQTCPQVLSVAASVPGYSTCVITLAQNLASNHAAGETVCDPLPPGVTSPSAVAASARLAY